MGGKHLDGMLLHRVLLRNPSLAFRPCSASTVPRLAQTKLGAASHTRLQNTFNTKRLLNVAPVPVVMRK